MSQEQTNNTNKTKRFDWELLKNRDQYLRQLNGMVEEQNKSKSRLHIDAADGIHVFIIGSQPAPNQDRFSISLYSREGDRYNLITDFGGVNIF